MAELEGKIQSVARALKILTLFENSEELGISEIAKRMNLSKSTTFGLVDTLVVYDFLEQNEDSKRYRLGIKNYELGRYFSLRMNWWEEAKPLLEKYIQPFGETIHSAYFDAGEIIYFNSITSKEFSVMYTQSGKRAPMYCNSLGKAILAYLSDEYLDEYVFSKPMIPMTQNTITDPDKLREELAETRKRGYAIDAEEIEIGISCVAVPVFGPHGKPIAAISVCAPTSRIIGDRRIEIAKTLVECVAQISKRIGYIKD